MIAKIFLSFIAIVLFDTSAAPAQIYQPSNRTPVADNTLGTQVAVTNNNFIINGGVIRGSSILHSFQDFSIPTGSSATFTTGAGTQAVVSRVTGNLSSDINGLINAPGANFFLINPNGVVLGPNSQLNVGGSFVATTAHSTTLSGADGTSYTFGTRNINDAPLLSINQNVGLNITGLNFIENSAPITSYANLQTNNANQYIGLIGGDITLDAGEGRGNIIAPGGRVDIGGLRSAGTANITAQGFEYQGANANSATSGGFVRSDLTLIDGVRIDVTTSQPVGSVNPFFFPRAASAGSVINVDVTNVRIFNREVNTTIIRFKEPDSREETAPPTSEENNPQPRPRRIGVRPSDRSLVTQACNSGNIKLVLTGRGGIQSNANDLLNSDVIWQDPRTTSSLITTVPSKDSALLPPPAIGWAMDSQGKIALLAAKSGETGVGIAAGCSS